MRVNIEQAIEILRKNKVVAIPTETVYGLGARVDSVSGVEMIFQTKKRPFFDPLIVHVSNLEMAKKYADWNPIAEKLAKSFWPGPLTIILPKKDNISDMITSGLPSVGLRCPKHPLTKELIKAIETPLCAPSANLFGKTSPTTADHVLDEFKSSVPVIDGGSCQVGIESTIVKIEDSQVQILRPGMISKEDLAQASGLEVIEVKMEHIPGGLENHYQPEIPLLLFPKELQLELIPKELKDKEILRLELSTKASIAARELYGCLRDFSKEENKIITLENFDSFDSPDFSPLKNRLLKASSFYAKKS